jgi:hypothetical protein
MGSEIYCLGEELESAFNRIWTEKIIFHVKQKENLKRARDANDADSISSGKLYILFFLLFYIYIINFLYIIY